MAKVAKPASAREHKEAPANGDSAAAVEFPIVGIGSSAGGLEAMENFFAHVPAGCGMAFVVIQHIDPTQKTLLPDLLQRTTRMSVRLAKNRMKVEPDCVYVIPPNKNLSLLHGTLFLFEPTAQRGLRLPIDFFFRSLAEDQCQLAVGVILSGMGSDGTLGLRSIKENAGLVLVQEPANAKFDSMPRSAIDEGLADIVAAPEELPQRIMDYLSHVPRIKAGEPGGTLHSGSSLEKVLILLRDKTGQDFSLYKKSTIYRRIERRMGIHQIAKIAGYVQFLQDNPQELDLLFKEFLIGVTSFFRDPPVWQYLRDHALPALLANFPEGRQLRAWVPACSTGEEAYSLAIVFRETIERLRPAARFSLQIFATDLDADAVARARQGHYPVNIGADVAPERLERFFVGDDNGFRIGQEIREMVVFAPQNVVMDPPFTKLDIITCRNLLIYFGAELQQKLLPLFHYSLNPGGLLLLGNAESIGNFTNLFSPIENKARLFQRTGTRIGVGEIEFPSKYFSPGPHQAPMVATSPLNIQSLADQVLLKKFAPAAILVTPHGDIVNITGRTGKYLEPPAGKANWNVHAMAREGLRGELAACLQQVVREGGTITRSAVKVATDAGMQAVNLSVHRIDEATALQGMVLIVLGDAPPPAAARGERAGRAGKRSAREEELEQALQQALMEIQATREEMQSSHEELRSTNEELQSTNEELQSTNEELTTSKEEMQSLNEELQTVNSELQAKLDDLSHANNDLQNLLNSTEIATVFLDASLCVRRFTPSITHVVKLIPGDVGRPLSDIVTDLVYPELQDDARQVLRTLIPINKQVITRDQRWFSVRVLPYRTLSNVIDGVVLTCSDITQIKELEARLRNSIDQAAAG
ncbi:MAG TPA: chemotaxis protein CheB [Azospira sp.]|nr:chemotaxis protein CheB [Azospira sp.]